jgi:hypothetical protein
MEAFTTRGPGLPMTRHALERIAARRIPFEAVEATIDWGRVWHHDGVLFFRLDRRTVRRASRSGEDVRRHEGVHVVCATGGEVLTLYRNREGRRVRR